MVPVPKLISLSKEIYNNFSEVEYCAQTKGLERLGLT